MPIVFAAPLTGPAGGLGANPRFMSWTGFDGTVWPLSDPMGRPAMQRGVKGLHMPRFNVYESSTPLVPGVELTGYDLPARTVYWPLMFQANSITQWEALHAGFFNSIHPIDPGVWTVGEGTAQRTLPLTGVFDGSYSFDTDPFIRGHALIGVELLAPRPLWRGRPITKTFRAQEGVPFIPVDLAPSFNISPAASFTTANISNPGDEPSYLVWTINGPMPEVELGVSGAIIEVPFALDEGDTLVIDTDPAGQYATLNGVDCTRELGFQAFAPVPPRGTSPLAIAATGDGSVSVSLTPLYWRAY
ncbi:hypothetical protein Q9R08_05225 [Microbacterium sp. QXD-8]|uniref:Phage tail protein n=1 Tax=Microbacterium psychrotolerans TaxID=3068321 RepID=A0ABU0YYG4_9MICO|nr:hypothetical protein [Microbacterium sp. QXD-8]MDQ7877375.1 hypothetical protein [Microbacterium sp. QXD-8]